MGIMMHLIYKTAGGGGVPSPVDGPDVTVWPLDDWASKIPQMARYGITVPVLPPMTKGGTLGSGYDPFDHFDIGSKNQRGRVETRYGHVDKAMRFVAIARAAGMQVYVNVVHHHVDGDRGDQIYQYVGADGKTKNGRFPKDHNCFTQTWPNPDTVYDSSWDLAFGREFMWNLGTYGDGLGDNGPGYVKTGLAKSLVCQMNRLGTEGCFHDDVKGQSPKYVGYLVRQPGIEGLVSFGELSDGQTSRLMNWIHNTEVNGGCGVLDFPLRYKIRDVLNHGADMRSILSEGVCWQDPARSVTFIENQDLAQSDPIIWNKLLGYAMIATFPGYPMFFLEDLVAHKLMEPALNLAWIHETFAVGDLWWRETARDHLVYERMGDGNSPGCLVGVSKRDGSYHTHSDWTQVTVLTKWVNTRLHDYSGHSKDQWTGNDGRVTIWIPPNEAGKGYVIFAPEGINNPIHLTPRSTTQVLEGAFDLDIPPAKDGQTYVGRVWAAAGTHIQAVLTADRTGWTSASEITFQILGPDASVVIDGTLGLSRQVAHSDSQTAAKGWHVIRLQSAGMPVDGSSYTVKVTYMGTQTLSPEEF